MDLVLARTAVPSRRDPTVLPVRPASPPTDNDTLLALLAADAAPGDAATQAAILAAFAAAPAAAPSAPRIERAPIGRPLDELPGDAATLLATSEAAAQDSEQIDQRQLAQQVYALIKQRLAVEVERAGLGPARRR